MIFQWFANAKIYFLQLELLIIFYVKIGKIMKLLLIAPYGIGNLVMFLPLMRALHKRGIAFDIVSFLKTVDVMLEHWDDFHLYQKKHFVGGGKWAVIKALSAIRSEHYDASMLSFPSARWHYNAFAFACGARIRTAAKYFDDSFGSLSFLNNKLIPVEDGLHDAYQNARIFSGIGINIEDSEIIPFTEKCDSAVIGIHPGCKKSESFKRWPLENWMDLIHRLSEYHPSYEIRVYFGPDEQEEQAVLGSINGIVCKTNLPLSTLHKDIGECGLFISNDSGMMHVATYTGAKIIAIIGPSDERRTGPFSPDATVLSAPCPIKPCSHSYLRTTHKFICSNSRICMTGVSVDEVIDATSSFFAGRITCTTGIRA